MTRPSLPVDLGSQLPVDPGFEHPGQKTASACIHEQNGILSGQDQHLPHY